MKIYLFIKNNYMNLLIQYILQELKNNKEDRERFNLINKEIQVHADTPLPFKDVVHFECIFLPHDRLYSFFEHMPSLLQIIAVHTALSRTKDGKAVLSGLEVYPKVDSFFRGIEGGLISNRLYETFDTPLRNGATLQEALDACDKYFIEEEGIIRLSI